MKDATKTDSNFHPSNFSSVTSYKNQSSLFSTDYKSSNLEQNDPYKNNNILKLQKTAGNQAVQRLIKQGKLQTKLKIGHPSDPYEQEADKLAEHVMRKSGSKQITNPTLTEMGARINRKYSSNKMKTKVEEGEKPNISRKPSTVSNFEVSNEATNKKINNIRSSRGFSLDSNTQEIMESGLGYDFSQVRIHSDSKAAESAETVNAMAYTIGKDIVFGKGQYSPNTIKGQRLLAHELAHSIQQNYLLPVDSALIQRQPDPWEPKPDLEEKRRPGEPGFGDRPSYHITPGFKRRYGQTTPPDEAEIEHRINRDMDLYKAYLMYYWRRDPSTGKDKGAYREFLDKLEKRNLTIEEMEKSITSYGRYFVKQARVMGRKMLQAHENELFKQKEEYKDIAVSKDLFDSLRLTSARQNYEAMRKAREFKEGKLKPIDYQIIDMHKGWAEEEMSKVAGKDIPRTIVFPDFSNKMGSGNVPPFFPMMTPASTKAQEDVSALQSAQKHPLLADPLFKKNLHGVATASSPIEIQTTMLYFIGRRLEDIKETRDNLADNADPKLIYKFDILMDATKKDLNIKPNSVYDLIIKAIKTASEESTLPAILLFIAAGILAVIPGLGWIALLTAAASLTYNVYKAFEAYKAYKKQLAGHGAGLASQQPTLGEVLGYTYAAILDVAFMYKPLINLFRRSGPVHSVPSGTPTRPTREPLAPTSPLAKSVTGEITVLGPTNPMRPTRFRVRDIRPDLPRSGKGTPRADLNIFRMSIDDPKLLAEQRKILKNYSKDAQKTGNDYQHLIKREFPGGGGFDLPQSAKRVPHTGTYRDMDIGNLQEITIEGWKGAFGSGKLNQLWRDLAKNGQVILTVPRLSPSARDQLERMLAQAKSELDENCIIIIRETVP